MRGCLRLFVAAFLTDAALYLAFAALPFRAIELGAGPARLGILPTLYAAAYMTCAAWGGRLSDRVPRLTLARGGCAVFVLGCLGIAAAPGLPILFAALPVLGLALGFFWSPLQAALSDRATGDLSRAVSAFNVSWSLGKGSGLLVGGLLTEALGPQPALLFAGVPVLVALVVLPRDRSPSRATQDRRAPAAHRPGANPDVTFLRLAWATNAIAFGLGSTMNVHAPKFLLAQSAGPSAFGVIIGSVFFAQTATFALLHSHRPGRGTLFSAYVLAAAALTLFLSAPDLGWRWAAALPLGVALGLAYQASIHASLDRATGRGRAAGLHETILGGGSSVLPMVGGALAALTASLAAPFWLGIGVLLAGLALTGALLRKP